MRKLNIQRRRYGVFKTLFKVLPHTLRWALTVYLIVKVYHEAGYYTAFSLALLFIYTELNTWLQTIRRKNERFLIDAMKITQDILFDILKRQKAFADHMRLKRKLDDALSRFRMSGRSIH